jgi:hypothetical protein
MRASLMMMVAVCGLPFAAPAQDQAPAAPPQGQGFGSQTRAWTTLQTSGTASVTDDRPMPGEVATMVYQRYLTSFTHPIPERYEANSFKVTGNTGSSN